MGLAVLPARLKTEMALLADCLVQGTDPAAREETAKHAAWAARFAGRYRFTQENAAGLLNREIGRTFEEVLEDAGVYKCTPEGREAFLRFLSAVGAARI